MKRRCLVIDDSDDIRLLLCLGLVQAGFEVVGEASTAASGFDAARASSPDIVLVDLLLPDGDSLETIRTLRSLLPCARIVVCSGLPAVSMASACLGAGADHFLEKKSLLDVGSILGHLLEPDPA